MISQVQENGTMRSSTIETTGLKIVSVADKPILRLNKQRVNEDSWIYLRDIIDEMKLQDNDGSEELFFRLSKVESDWDIIEIKDEDNREYEVLDKENIFERNKVNSIALIPAMNESGNFDVRIHAISNEKENGSRAETSQEVRINIKAETDRPNQLQLKEYIPELEQDGTIELRNIFEIVNAEDLLIDTDGSEQLRVRIDLNKNLLLLNNVDNSWSPININEINDEIYRYVFNYSDIEYLSIRDND